MPSWIKWRFCLACTEVVPLYQQMQPTLSELCHRLLKSVALNCYNPSCSKLPAIKVAPNLQLLQPKLLQTFPTVMAWVVPNFHLLQPKLLQTSSIYSPSCSKLLTFKALVAPNFQLFTAKVAPNFQLIQLLLVQTSNLQSKIRAGRGSSIGSMFAWHASIP